MKDTDTAIVRREEAKLTAPEELTVEQVVAQVQKIQQVMAKAMTEGEHYGVIPGTKKPTLLKPGAEKLCLTFRLEPQYEILPNSIQRDNFISYTIRCLVVHIPTGNRIASGLGSCNSREAKYRWREGKRKCPKCSQEAIIKGKEEYGGGWVCFAKKGGCGAKWPDGALEIEGQQVGQIENDNPWDLDNPLLKMGCKRALVAAVLNGTAASDIFSQDLEEMVVGESGAVVNTKTGEIIKDRQPPTNHTTNAKQAPATSNNTGMATPLQRARLFELSENKQVDEKSRNWILDNLDELTQNTADEVIRRLEEKLQHGVTIETIEGDKIPSI